MSAEGPRVRQIVLEVTSACNLDCSYCYNVWKAPGGAYPRGQLPLADLLRLLEGLLDEVSPESVAISGGEPFLRADLPRIVAYLWSRHVRTVVITNGTLLTPERIAATPGVANYELPLLSYRRAVHDALTRRQAFDRVIDGALNLRRAGERFAMAFVATRLNYRDLSHTLELAVALGAESLMYNRMNVSAHNLLHGGELLPTPGMIRENLEVLESFAARHSFPIACSIPIQPCLLDTSPYAHLHFAFCPLGGESSYFTVDPLGNLRVCNHSSRILGNLLERSFAELCRDPYVEAFRTVMPAGCRACPAAIRDRCHGGCKAAAAECYGSFEAEEPFLACHPGWRTMPCPATASPSA